MKKLISLILALAMVVSLVPLTAFAQEDDADAGTPSAVAGAPCNHVHTEGCYREVTRCIHVHDETCGYVPAVDEVPCDCEPDENGVIHHVDGCGYVAPVPEVPCNHVCSVESGCVTLELDCHHVHDETCGYVEAKDEIPDPSDSSESSEDGTEEPSPAQQLQERINALPDAEAITEENLQAVKAELESIGQQIGQLEDEIVLQLDLTRLTAAQEAVLALEQEIQERENSLLTAADIGDSFTTFEELKILAGESYDTVRYVTYEGEGPLVIQEALTIPQNLVIYASRVTVPSGVTLTLNYHLECNTLTVDGTLEVYGWMHVYDTLTVNGSLHFVSGEVYMQYPATIVGEENISASHTGSYIFWDCYCRTREELDRCLNLAQENANYTYKVMLYSTTDLSGVTIPEGVIAIIERTSAPTVPAGTTMTVNGALHIWTGLNVEGTLQNNGYLEVEEDAVLEIGESGTYEGNGYFCVHADSTGEDLPAMLPGLDLSRFRILWDVSGVWGLLPLEPQELATPTDLQWGFVYADGEKVPMPGGISWKVNKPYQGIVEVKIYREGSEEPVFEGTRTTPASEARFCSSGDFLREEPESGTYYFTVTAIGDGIYTCNSETAVSEAFVYEKPAQSLGACQILSWNGNDFTWRSPENIGSYQLQIYFSPTEKGKPEFVGEHYNNWLKPESDVYRSSMVLQHMGLRGEGYYSFRMRAISSDATKYQNGPWTPMQGPYYLSRSSVIGLNQEYITLREGETAQITANIAQDMVGFLHWSVQNEEGNAQNILSVSDDGVVTALNAGTAYVVASVGLFGETFSARCRVDVQPAGAGVKDVQLGTDKTNLELFSSQYVSIDMVLLLEQNKPAAARSAMRASAPQNNGVAIEEARFADEATAACFDLVVKDDRTLLVVPKESAIQNPASVKNSYTSAVVVSVCGQEYTTTASMKLTVKKTMPRLKATALTFNPFFTNQSQAVTVTGATVTGVSVDASKATAKVPAIPNWLTLEDGILTLTDDAPKSGSGRVNLLVETEEWAIPIPVTVSVRLSYKAPGLKLSTSTVTVPYFSHPDDRNMYSRQGGWLYLLCKNKGDTLQSLGVSHIEADGWMITLNEGGDFGINPLVGEIPKPGKITLKVHFYGTDSVVELPLTVKTQLIPIKVSTYYDYYKSDYKLNANILDGFFVTWYKPVYNFINIEDYKLAWEIQDKWGNIVTDTFNTYLREDDQLAVWTTDASQPGIYKLLMDLDKDGKHWTEESAVVPFTVLPESKKPTLSVKVSSAIDLTYPDTRVWLNFQSSNYFVMNFEKRVFTITDGKGKDVTDQFQIYWDYGLYIRPLDTASPGSYKLDAKITLDLQKPDVSTVSCSTKFTVKRTPIKLKLSKTSLTLNKFIGDAGVVDVTCQTKGYTLTDPIVKVMDSRGKASAEGCLDVRYYDSGMLFIATNERTMAGSSYRVLIQARDVDAPVTLTVKIPAKTASVVTATLRAKGAIDPIRDGTSVTITSTYKNYMGQTPLDRNVRVMCSKDGRNYTRDVTNSFAIMAYADGSYTVWKRPGLHLDPSLKYRFELSFPGTSASTPAYLALPIRSNSARVTLNGSAVLYKQDKYSRNRIPFSIADKTLNQIAQVRIKDQKMAALYEIHDYGNGEYAIGFKDNIAPASAKSGSVALEIFFDGNASDKPNATVTLKVQIK